MKKQLVHLRRNSPTRARAASFSRFIDHTPQSVGLLWTRDQPVAETVTWQHTQHSQEIYIHAPEGIRTRNPRKPATTDLAIDRSATGIDETLVWKVKYDDVNLINVSADMLDSVIKDALDENCVSIEHQGVRTCRLSTVLVCYDVLSCALCF